MLGTAAVLQHELSSQLTSPYAQSYTAPVTSPATRLGPATSAPVLQSSASSPSITSAPWFPWVLGGVVGGVVLFLIVRK